MNFHRSTSLQSGISPSSTKSRTPTLSPYEGEEIGNQRLLVEFAGSVRCDVVHSEVVVALQQIDRQLDRA